MRLTTNEKALIGAYMERASQSPQNERIPLFCDHTLRYLNVELKRLQRSKFTINSITSSLSLLVRYAWQVRGLGPDVFSISHCTSDFIRDWLNYEITEHKISAATRNLRLSHLRCYVMFVAEFCFKACSIYLSLKQIPKMKVIQQEKTLLTEGNISSMLKAVITTEKGKRNALILLILYECAMRASELTALKVKDVINIDGKFRLNIMGKGKRQRYTPIKEETAEMLNAYLRVFHESSSPDTPLFYSIRKEKPVALTVKTVETIVNQAADLAREHDTTIPKRVHPHAFRRSKATALYQKGTPIEIVSSFIGHSSTETTKIYTTPSEEQLRKAMEKCDFPDEWKNAKENYTEEDLKKKIVACGLTP